MKKRDRVFAAIKHETVDHVPAYFTTHFTKDKHFDDPAVEEHLRFYEEVNPDIQKIMNENLVPYFGMIKTPDDWKCIPKLDRNSDFMRRQLEMVKKIFDRMDKDAFNIGTLHGIVASSIHPIEWHYGYEPVRELLCAHLREKKEPVLDAMKRIAEGLCDLARAYMEIGLDGILYASLGGERHYFTDEEFEEYIAPLDKLILQTAKEAGGHNILHMCKQNVNFDRYQSYKGLYEISNWGVYEAHLSLTEGRACFPDGAVLGGLSNQPDSVLCQGSREEIEQEIDKVLAEVGREGFILGTDCTIPTGVSYRQMRIATDYLKRV
ncbi:MAG: uroporphyrinogen decarboxylase family protein [Eubacteriales bacterium]|nr:uroporphyrinogen decarboxylase family protein [Eubacteriales bacterium]